MTDDFEAIIETGAALGVEAAASAAARGEGNARTICPNCGAKLVGPYCAQCGQERDTHRRSLVALIHDFVQDVVNLDSRILRTARALLFEPGELPRAFQQGRTRAYVPAVRLYLFVTLVFFVMLSFGNLALIQLEVTATPMKVSYDAKGNAYFTNPSYDASDPDAKLVPPRIPISKETLSKKNGKIYSYATDVHFFAPIGAYKSKLSEDERARLTNPTVSFDIDTGKKATALERKVAADKTENWVQTHVFGGLKRLVSDPAALNGPLTNWIPRILFLLLPIYAGILALFYIRQRKTFYFVDHLIFSLSIHTFTFVLLIAAAGLAQFLSGDLIAFLLLAALTVYIFLAIRKFYEQSWFWTSVKFVSISGIYTVFFLLPALGIATALSFFDVPTVF